MRVMLLGGSMASGWIRSCMNQWIIKFQV
jgi:hypothetical protein